jgi:hypothetical protein
VALTAIALPLPVGPLPLPPPLPPALPWVPFVTRPNPVRFTFEVTTTSTALSPSPDGELTIVVATLAEPAPFTKARLDAAFAAVVALLLLCA